MTPRAETRIGTARAASSSRPIRPAGIWDGSNCLQNHIHTPLSVPPRHAPSYLMSTLFQVSVHNPSFVLNEGVLQRGVALHTHLALQQLDYLAGQMASEGKVRGAFPRVGTVLPRT